MDRAENRATSIAEYGAEADALKSTPRFLIVELTQGCNLHCEMCRSERISVQSRQMDESIYRQVRDAFFAQAELVDLRGWGESLLVADFERYVMDVVDAGARARVVTNLSFSRDRALDLLAAHKAMVTVSLDSADPETLKRLRGGARPDLIFRNMRYLGERYGDDGAGCLSIGCTVQRPGLPTLHLLADLAAQSGISLIRLSEVTIEATSPLSVAGAANAVDDAVRLLAEKCRTYGIRLTFSTQVGTHRSKVSRPPACIHPWVYLYVAYDGGVGFCDHLIGPHGKKYEIGNLADRSLEAIWNAQSWQQLRAEHRGARRADAPMFDECAWCYANRFGEFEEMFVPGAESGLAL